MQAYAIEKYQQKHLKRMELPIPSTGEYEVLVEIHAASVNPVDFKIRDGKVKVLLKYQMPLVLGNDFAGIITKIGNKVTKFQVGDEIYCRAPKDKIGSFAEYIAVHEDSVAHKPKNLSFVEAASIPLVGLTSYQVMHDVMKLQPDQKILIQAGAGGVGTFAIQLAKTMGAYVATTASDSDYELVKKLGADKIINYKKQKFEQELQNYDAVYDTLGSPALDKAFQVVKPGGHIVSVSGLPNARFGKEYQAGFIKTCIFTFITRKITQLEKKHDVRYTFLFMKPSGEQLDTIRQLIEAGKIHPVIDRVFAFNDTQSAIEYVASGRAKGKVVIDMKQ